MLKKWNALKILKNSKGLSILQVMGIVALLGAMTAAVMNMSKIQSKAQKRATLRVEINALKENIERHLFNAANCRATFSTSDLDFFLDANAAATITELAVADSNWNPRAVTRPYDVGSTHQGVLKVIKYDVQNVNSASRISSGKLIVTVETVRRGEGSSTGTQYEVPIDIVFLFNTARKMEACYAQARSGGESFNTVYGISKRLCFDMNKAITGHNSLIGTTEGDLSPPPPTDAPLAHSWDDGICQNLPQLIVNESIARLCEQIAPEGAPYSIQAPDSTHIPVAAGSNGFRAVPVRAQAVNAADQAIEFVNYYQCVHRYNNFTCDNSLFPDTGRPGGVQNVFLKAFDTDGNPVCACQPRECPDSKYICQTDIIGTDWCGNYCNRGKTAVQGTTSSPNTYLGEGTYDASFSTSSSLSCFSTTPKTVNGTSYDEMVINTSNQFCGQVPQVCPQDVAGGTDKFCPKKKCDANGNNCVELEYFNVPASNGCGVCPPFKGTKPVDDCLVEPSCPVLPENADRYCNGWLITHTGGVCLQGKWTLSGDNSRQRGMYCLDQPVYDPLGNNCQPATNMGISITLDASLGEDEAALPYDQGLGTGTLIRTNGNNITKSDLANVCPNATITDRLEGRVCTNQAGTLNVAAKKATTCRNHAIYDNYGNNCGQTGSVYCCDWVAPPSESEFCDGTKEGTFNVSASCGTKNAKGTSYGVSSCSGQCNPSTRPATATYTCVKGKDCEGHFESVSGTCAQSSLDCSVHTNYVSSPSTTKDGRYVIDSPAENGGAACPYTDGQVVPNAMTCGRCECFVKGTEITMADGTKKLIENIEVGDFVQGSNNSINMVLELKHSNHEGKKYSINGSEPFVTEGHPFRVRDPKTGKEQWKAFNPELAIEINPKLQIGKLKIGDLLIKENEETEVLEEFYYTENSSRVYNFELNGTKDYYADDFLVHNK